MYAQRLIDLKRRYDIHFERVPSRPESWEATDRVTFDPDPESSMHLIGRGFTTHEALRDLLDQIAEVAAR